MRLIAIITIVMNLIYEVSKLRRSIEAADYELSFDSVFSVVISIFVNVVICMGAYLIENLMDEVLELKSMVASQKNNIVGRQYGSNVNIPSYNYQNPAYVNQNVQNTGYVESQPISDGWTCSCGAINKNDVYYCMQCGKKRE